MIEEFKKFALRGNAVDLAIGVIIGAAFGAIVNSLVVDIISPIIGAVTGGFDAELRFLLAVDWQRGLGPLSDGAPARACPMTAGIAAAMQEAGWPRNRTARFA